MNVMADFDDESVMQQIWPESVSLLNPVRFDQFLTSYYFWLFRRLTTATR